MQFDSAVPTGLLNGIWGRPVPEPSTIVLSGLGAVTVFGARRAG
ncbi:MAG: PEP-CTERM sorting domain-containing protein [Phycisphaerales bacterium]|nr:MAG: PEP-CTERM sorting domain-containing protein [Phycisphaerales bacterium]